MIIRLTRFASNGHATLGHICTATGEPMCFTLEDRKQPPGVKVPGQTRIPAGTYEIDLRNEGSVTKKYAARFPGIHRGMLWLREVPDFTYIYIHCGNTDADTSGCILTGFVADGSRFELHRSADAYRAVYSVLSRHAANNDLKIIVTD